MFCKNAKKWFETLPMFTNVHLARDNFHLFNLNDLATVSPDSIHPPNSPDQSKEELKINKWFKNIIDTRAQL